jgi:hypothetical protein
VRIFKSKINSPNGFRKNGREVGKILVYQSLTNGPNFLTEQANQHSVDHWPRKVLGAHPAQMRESERRWSQAQLQEPNHVGLNPSSQ